MSEQIEADLAYIRQAVANGRRVVNGWGWDFAVWGGLIAIGHLAQFRQIAVCVQSDSANMWCDWRGGLAIWLPVMAIGWIAARFLGRHRDRASAIGLSARALVSVWTAVAITMTLYALVLGLTRGQSGLTTAVAAGLMGSAYFVSGELCERRWLKGLAAVWWVGMVAAILLRDQIESTIVGAALFFFLMALPGLKLARRGA